MLGVFLARAAPVLAGAFVAAGTAAVFTPVGVFAGIGLSVLQALWFLAAGIRLMRRAGTADAGCRGGRPRGLSGARATVGFSR